jgi:hypothetical protein
MTTGKENTPHAQTRLIFYCERQTFALQHHLLTSTSAICLALALSRKEIWESHFNTFKNFYKENNHRTLPRDYPEYTKLSQWLTYQRHHAKTLTKNQLERLESIHFMDAQVVRSVDEKEWLRKLDRLENIYQETGLLRVPQNERDLANWLSNQRKLMRKDFLDPIRKERLLQLGIRPSAKRYAKKDSLRNDAKWETQFAKLQTYHKDRGNCNVPNKWKDDPSLGFWVSSQRTLYKKMKTGESDMDQNRIEKMEELGFEWRLGP